MAYKISEDCIGCGACAASLRVHLTSSIPTSASTAALALRPALSELPLLSNFSIHLLTQRAKI